jgi:DNA-binding FrmR family transcriptional regulator
MNKAKQQTLINFRKTRSLLDKIIKMIGEDKYCIDIMQQNLAAIGLLKSANSMLMEGHLNSCFKSAVISKNSAKQQKMIMEILKVTKLTNR